MFEKEMDKIRELYEILPRQEFLNQSREIMREYSPQGFDCQIQFLIELRDTIPEPDVYRQLVGIDDTKMGFKLRPGDRIKNLTDDIKERWEMALYNRQ